MTGALTGKAAIVSGAAGGIGRAIALAFAEAGAAVAAIDIDAPGAAETAALVEARGRPSLARPCDVASESETGAAAAATYAAFGRLDILVSGAAAHDRDGSIVETSLAEWDRVIAVNLTGAFLLAR